MSAVMSDVKWHTNLQLHTVKLVCLIRIVLQRYCLIDGGGTTHKTIHYLKCRNISRHCLRSICFTPRKTINEADYSCKGWDFSASVDCLVGRCSDGGNNVVLPLVSRTCCAAGATKCNSEGNIAIFMPQKHNALVLARLIPGIKEANKKSVIGFF